MLDRNERTVCATMSPNIAYKHTSGEHFGLPHEHVVHPEPLTGRWQDGDGSFRGVTEPESTDGKADRSWIGYGLGNVAGAVAMATDGLMWVAAIFVLLAIICAIQLVR